MIMAIPDTEAIRILLYPHCGRQGCQCTHTNGCVCGWIEAELPVRPGTTDPAARRCPVCYPDRVMTPEERADIAMGRARWLERMRRANAAAARNKDRTDDSEDW